MLGGHRPAIKARGPMRSIGGADGWWPGRHPTMLGLGVPGRGVMADLRHYRYFVEIARRGTFTAAAEALNMTQSALSEQILQLERECGSLLFNRHHHGITLTPAGEYLLTQAETLLGKAAEMRDGLAG